MASLARQLISPTSVNGKRTVGPRRETAGSISYLLLKWWTVGPRPGPWTYCPTHGFLLTRV
ncbi:hypothetical protein J6590_089871 [Homalodisca vitripennis]|nr:hypothetical protein J6590_089871 [Homalodisca vitripennis]